MSEPDSPNPAPAPDLTVRVAELEVEVARLRDTLLRSQADQQNQQRRHARDREDLRKYATASLIEDLLPALDALALGMESAKQQTEGKAVAEGFRMAVQQLRSVFTANGLSEINPLGLPFNPVQHETVGQQASEAVAEGSVVIVARPGWALNDRVLRPASVILSTGPATPNS
jgi:molecular chaperone GrpE